MMTSEEQQDRQDQREIDNLSRLVFKKLRCSNDLTIIHYTVALHEETITSINKLIVCPRCTRRYSFSDVFFSERQVPEDFNEHYLLVTDEIVSLNHLLGTIVQKIKVYETDESLVYRNGALDALRALAHEFVDSNTFAELEKGELKVNNSQNDLNTENSKDSVAKTASFTYAIHWNEKLTESPCFFSKDHSIANIFIQVKGIPNPNGFGDETRYYVCKNCLPDATIQVRIDGVIRKEVS